MAVTWDTTWSVDKYRVPSEPSHQWELRKKFMETHKHRIPKARLVCLAQCLVNSEFMGCRYPQNTMDELEKLSHGMLGEIRDAKMNKIQRTFVSGSEAARSKVNRAPKRSITRERDVSANGEAKRQRVDYPNFTRASDQMVDPETNINAAEDDIQQPASRTKAANVFGSEERDENAKIADQFSHPPPSCKSQESAQSSRSINLHFNYNFPLYDFFLVILDYAPEENACQILSRSGAFCKREVQWYKSGVVEGKPCFEVTIDKILVSKATGNSGQEAKDNAANEALDILRKNVYTIRVKNKYLSDGTEVDLINVQQGSQAGNQLKDSNVGHKLLKLMGWSGGGLGKGGVGISEPITAQSVFGRQGLGSTDAGREFKKKIDNIIKEYVGSSSPFDLVFTTGFTPDQRKEMHMRARVYNLKSKSYGKGDNRHITMSRKFDCASLVSELLERGGEMERYVLEPPGSS